MYMEDLHLRCNLQLSGVQDLTLLGEPLGTGLLVLILQVHTPNSLKLTIGVGGMQPGKIFQGKGSPVLADYWMFMGLACCLVSLHMTGMVNNLRALRH